AAVAILQAEKTANAGRVAAIRADAPLPVLNAAAPNGEADSGKTPEEKARAKWDADPKLQAEFGGLFGAYLSYQNATAAGHVRTAGKK
ncbi:MAG TPA: hypothetical protein VFH22_05290, partial [Rhodocyclaceae bacterium]|nr:hypothetical protein [Rhodocyclaceae bacterium]